MILDQVYRAIGSSRVYPVSQLLVLMFVLFLCTHNLQKVSLLSWSPDVFCAVKNETGKLFSLYEVSRTLDGVTMFTIMGKKD